MKKISKKIIPLIMCFLMALSAIGCSNITVTEDNKSSGDNSSIPKDGIVSEEVFKKLKDSGFYIIDIFYIFFRYV